MFHIYRKNAISEEGLKSLLPHFALTDEQEEAEGILVRSADMHEEKLGAATLAVARAGAGVNNIPLERFAEEGVVVFNTPGANANSVKELVLCGLLLAARNVLPAVEWLREKQGEARGGRLGTCGQVRCSPAGGFDTGCSFVAARLNRLGKRSPQPGSTSFVLS